jgi:hypothetical protein
MTEFTKITEHHRKMVAFTVAKLMSPKFIKFIKLRMLMILIIFQLQSQRTKYFLGLIYATMKT